MTEEMTEAITRVFRETDEAVRNAFENTFNKD